jgi:2-keto-4-pentenoate hydratase/2-oxohepta-3-ene-1,7-dioic acid hydratase in catechol pathway
VRPPAAVGLRRDLRGFRIARYKARPERELCAARLLIFRAGKVRIIRYLDNAMNVGYASQQSDGSAFEIKGDILGKWEVTQAPAQVKKLLAPIVPPTLWCIGVNYRRHAEEAGAKNP